MSRLSVIEVKPNESYKILAWLIFALGALFYCYEYILRVSTSVTANGVMQAFHLNASQYGGLSAYYYYAYFPLQLFVGLLMDRYGPRKLLVLCCLICAFGSFIFAHSHSLFFMKLSRFLIGFGSAFAFVGALKLASIWLPPEKFAPVAGIVTMLGMLGAIFAQTILSHIVAHYGWRTTVAATAWGGIGLTILMLLIIRDKIKTMHTSYIPQLDFSDLMRGLLISLRNYKIWLTGIIGLILFLPVTSFADLWCRKYLMTYGLNLIQVNIGNARRSRKRVTKEKSTDGGGMGRVT